MTSYIQWRNYGFRSRLSEIAAGPSGTQKQAENTQIQASQQEMSLAQQQSDLQKQQYDQYQKDIQPLETKLTALSSGDRSQALSAAMPVISQVSGGYDSAKQHIMNSIPPGVARDTALANLEVQKSTATSGTLAKEVQDAPATLANLGTGIGAFSIQQLGAALSGYSGASASSGQVAQEENAAQANKVGLISGLAESAGSALPIFKKSSDLRLKANIRPLYPILDKLLQMRVVRFDYRAGSQNQIGVIAQEVRKLIPESVVSTGDSADTLMVDWSMLAAAALQGIQELTKRVHTLEKMLRDERSAGLQNPA